MKVVVISARYPENGRKGDQNRGFAVVRRLAERHEVSVVTASAPSQPEAARALESLATVHVCAAGYRRRGASAAAMLRRGLPGQVGWMMPPSTWRRARAAAAGTDVALVCTARSIRGPLPVPILLDHVDALSLNMRRRAHSVEPLPIRLAAAVEAKLLRRWERRVAAWVTAQTVTSAEDAAELPAEPPVGLVPSGIDRDAVVEPAGHERDIDLIFTGNMSYPPNREAAEWLDREVVPRVRRRLPEARTAVVGRNARRLRLSHAEVLSDVPDMSSLLRRARVAAAPLRSGTGSPYKVLEAAACGAALVTSPWVAEHFGLSCPTADDADAFAAAVIRLLEDDARRQEQTETDRAVLERYSAEALAQSMEERLLAACGAVEQSPAPDPQPAAQLSRDT